MAGAPRARASAAASPRATRSRERTSARAGAPGSAAAQMVEAIIKDQKRIFPVCIKLEGEYGIDDCYLGVPVVLGSNGVEKVIELNLNSEELKLLEESRQHVKEVMSVLDNL